MAFKPGQSGNPAGARKKNTIVSDLAAKEAPNAFAGIVALAMTCPDLRIRLDALKYIVDRNMGRPAQAVEVSGQITNYVARLPAVINSTSEWIQTHKLSGNPTPVLKLPS